MSDQTDPLTSASRRGFLRRLPVGGGSAVALTVAGVPAQAGDETTAERAPTGEYHPELGQGRVTAAIQDAIDRAAAAGGGTVVLPGGDFDLDDDLRLPSHVTLRGVSWSGSVVRSTGGSAVLFVGDTEGAALETLTVPAIRFSRVASFCVLRRVRVLGAPEDAVVLPTDRAHHLSIEQLTVEDAGGDGVAHRAADARGVFLSEVSVTGFGRVREGACGIRVEGRAHISQVHIEPVRAGQVGVAFAPGSDYSSLTNYTMRLEGGVDVRVEPAGLAVAVGTGAVG